MTALTERPAARAAASAPRRRLRGVWWLSPAGAVALVVPVSLYLAASRDDSAYRRLWGTPKALDSDAVALFSAGVGLFVVGALLPLLGRRVADQSAAWPPFSGAGLLRLRRAAGVLFWLTIAGYVVLGALGVSRGATPAQLLHALTSQDTFGSTLEEEFAPVAGLTTLTQLGIAYVVVGLLVLACGPDRRTLRRLVLVVVLALARAFFLTERLAVLELAIPAVVVLALRAASGRRRVPRVGVRWLPLLLVPGVFAVFSAFEYSRSWVFYSQRTHGTFLQFAADRLAGYYATAYNNGQLFLDHGPRVRLPYGTVEAFWTAPGISQLGLYQRLTGSDQPTDFTDVLVQHGNPEFNNPGGVVVPFIDYGTVGGLVFFLVVGLLLGWMYRRCCEGSTWAVLLYPLTVTGSLEMPRYLYWGQGRVAPAIVALLVTAWCVERARRTKRQEGSDGLDGADGSHGPVQAREDVGGGEGRLLPGHVVALPRPRR